MKLEANTTPAMRVSTMMRNLKTPILEAMTCPNFIVGAMQSCMRGKTMPLDYSVRSGSLIL